MSRESSSTPIFFEQSGTDPGLTIPSTLPEEPRPEADQAGLAMTMIEHIAELRQRILLCASVLAALLCLGFFYALPIIQVFKAMAPSSIVFVQLKPGEVLMASVRLSFYIGVALALPVILYNFLRFVLPGLLPRERAMALWGVVGGTLLFLSGVVFAYFFVVPSALTFLVDYGQSVAATQLSIENYIAFCSALLFVTGVMFELPMALFLLSFTGLITSAKLIREWRWATILIFIVSAIVTPSQDPFSMTLVGLAMVFLYGLSIIPIKLCGR
ncbi:MAG TPA: twin-arginine translocase subunit TatC [Coleofasciculaceae cyanobacterium]